MTAPGQADEHTPTENEVREQYSVTRSSAFDPVGIATKALKVAAFDRWFAANNRAVREAALEEGVRAAAERWWPFLSPPPQEREIAEIVRAAANQTGESNANWEVLDADQS